MNKPLANVSLDLDNLWTYLKVHGEAGWDSFPTYLDTFVPYVLNALDDLGLNITFFVVGKDATLEENRDYLQELVRRGHEVGNHSFLHESWLQRYSREQLEEEIDRTDEHIERVTGQRPVGFRGPGFSWSPVLLQVLQERGYLYDASTFPTYIGPLARMYYNWTADFSAEEKELRSDLFGSFRDGLRSLKPYFWKLTNESTLLEMPVSTIPIIKTPFHLSYLVFLYGISPALMKLYFNLALQMCRLTGTSPSFLVHPTDLIDGDQAPAMKFFPGMQISSAVKMDIFRQVITRLARHYTLVGMGTHARSIVHSNPPVRDIQLEKKARA